MAPAAEGDGRSEVGDPPTMPAPLSDSATTTTPDGHQPQTPRERPIPAIEGYEILGELGRGGMGIVYRARHVPLNRPCVLKMILAGDHADAGAIVVVVSALGLAGILWQWSEPVQARDLASQRAIAEAEARRQAEITLVDMHTTSGIQAGDQGENGRAVLWFANAARMAKGDPDRQRANAIRARTWGRRAFVPLHSLVAEKGWPGGSSSIQQDTT
jgi:hypothetical protein